MEAKEKVINNGWAIKILITAVCTLLVLGIISYITINEKRLNLLDERISLRVIAISGNTERIVRLESTFEFIKENLLEIKKDVKELQKP